MSTMLIMYPSLGAYSKQSAFMKNIPTVDRIVKIKQIINITLPSFANKSTMLFI